MRRALGQKRERTPVLVDEPWTRKRPCATTKHSDTGETPEGVPPVLEPPSIEIRVLAVRRRALISNAFETRVKLNTVESKYLPNWFTGSYHCSDSEQIDGYEPNVWEDAVILHKHYYHCEVLFEDYCQTLSGSQALKEVQYKALLLPILCSDWKEWMDLKGRIPCERYPPSSLKWVHG